MLQALILAAALSPAAPLPYTVREGEPRCLDTESDDPLWSVYIRWRPGEYAEDYPVYPGLVLTVDGRRADLGELPGLLDRRWFPGEGGWERVPRVKRVRAWLRGGRLEMLEFTSR